MRPDLLLRASLSILTTTATAVPAAATLAMLASSVKQVPAPPGPTPPYGALSGSLLPFFLVKLRRWKATLLMRSRPGLRGRPPPTGLLMWRRKPPRPCQEGTRRPPLGWPFPLLLPLLETPAATGSLGPPSPPIKPRRPWTLRPPLGRLPLLWTPLPPSPSPPSSPSPPLPPFPLSFCSFLVPPPLWSLYPWARAGYPLPLTMPLWYPCRCHRHRHRSYPLCPLLHRGQNVLAVPALKGLPPVFRGNLERMTWPAQPPAARAASGAAPAARAVFPRRRRFPLHPGRKFRPHSR